MKLAFWPAPRDENVARIKVLRASSISGTYIEIEEIEALDPYDNWVTHYEDANGSDGDYYKANYLYEDGSSYLLWGPEEGVDPLCVTPQDVLDTIQGLPLNFVDAQYIQKWIEFSVAYAEKKMRMKLSPTTVTKEIHDYRVYEKILGVGAGARSNRIQLRNKPVTTVDAVYYRVRGASGVSRDTEWEDLDIQIEYNSDPDGYNRGIISITPRILTTSFYQGAIFQTARRQRAISILFNYTHGFSSCPRMIEEAILKYAAQDVMEIAGQAETAGLASRSIDGYSESFTASATTTQFSALRIKYKDDIDKILLKHWRKPIWS